MMNKIEFFDQYQDLNRQLSKSGLLLLQYFIADASRLQRSQKVIAEDLGKCRATVNRSIKLLVNAGHIEYNNKFASNRYTKTTKAKSINDIFGLMTPDEFKEHQEHKTEPIDISGFDEMENVTPTLKALPKTNLEQVEKDELEGAEVVTQVVDVSFIDETSDEYKTVIKHYNKNRAKNCDGLYISLANYLVEYPEHYYYLYKYYELIGKNDIYKGDVNIWQVFNVYGNPHTHPEYLEKYSRPINVTPILEPAPVQEKGKKEVIETYLVAKMQENGLTQANWTYTYDNRKGRLGCCDYRRKQICISEYAIQHYSIEEMKNTVLHEIAHALVGKSNGHNRVFKQKLIELGGNGKRTATEKLPESAYKYVGMCPAGHIYYANKRTYSSCNKCSSKFNRNYLIKWEINNIKIAI